MTPSDTFDMSDRVAMVSGAGRGMGRAMALAFAGAGADVVVVDIDEASNQETASEIEGLGRRALPVACDVSDCEAIESMYRTIDAEFGRIDVVANVAGDGVLAEPEEMTREQLLEALPAGAVDTSDYCYG